MDTDQLDQLTDAVVNVFRLTPQAVVLDAAKAISKTVVRGITHLMKNNGNDQVGLVEQSFIHQLDYPDGIRHGVEVQDLTSNMWYDYMLVGDENL